MRTFAVLSLIGATYAFSTDSAAYMQYLAQQGKSYNSIEEFDMRL